MYIHTYRVTTIILLVNQGSQKSGHWNNNLKGYEKWSCFLSLFNMASWFTRYMTVNSQLVNAHHTTTLNHGRKEKSVGRKKNRGIKENKSMEIDKKEE